MARSFASLEAFFVNEKYPMLEEDMPSSNSFSTIDNRYVVFPLPGGPKILWIWLKMATLHASLVFGMGRFVS